MLLKENSCFLYQLKHLLAFLKCIISFLNGWLCRFRDFLLGLFLFILCALSDTSTLSGPLCSAEFPDAVILSFRSYRYLCALLCPNSQRRALQRDPVAGGLTETNAL